MLNCSDPECILHHHHHYYHGHVQHHLQDDRVHHEHPTHHPMSGESDGVQDAVIQGYLNDTDSELSSLSHLDAPSESVYMICGVLIAMLLVGFIIVLLAVTIRYKSPTRSLNCCSCRKLFMISKLRKREDTSGVHRTNVVHPEGVLQALQVEPPPEAKSSPLEDIFITPVTDRSSLSCSHSGTSLSSYESSLSEPMFLYSTGNSRNSLNSNDQRTLVHPSGPAEDIENNNNHNQNNNNHPPKKNIKGKIRKLLHKKTPPTENYALPYELREQLKQIYVY